MARPLPNEIPPQLRYRNGSYSTTAIFRENLAAPTKTLYFNHLKWNMAIRYFPLGTRSNSIFLMSSSKNVSFLRRPKMPANAYFLKPTLEFELHVCMIYPPAAAESE